MKLWTKIVIAVVICMSLGGMVGWLTNSDISTWYTQLNKPSFNPPNSIFGPVWSVLYFLMGISVALIWHSNHIRRGEALMLFIIQFVLNLLWSIIFFKFHAIGAALIEIIILWIAILLTIIAFYKINKTAAWLLVPYLCWVSFAAFLTYNFYVLN